MSAPLKSVEGNRRYRRRHGPKSAARRAAPPRRGWRSPPPRRKDRALRAHGRRHPGADNAAFSPTTPRMSPRRAAPALTGAFLDRLTLDADAHRGDGRGHRRDRALPDPGRRRDRILDAAERPEHRARARAARRHRHHLREPAECDRRCRRALPEGRQCRDPARRLRQLALEPRHPSPPRPRSARGRPARGRDPAGADARPRRRRNDAGRPRRHHRRHRAARRQGPGRPRAGGSARAGFAHLEGVCHVYVDKAASSRWPRRSSSTPRCGAPASAARPKRCWSTAPRPPPTSSRWSRC